MRLNCFRSERASTCPSPKCRVANYRHHLPIMDSFLRERSSSGYKRDFSRAACAASRRERVANRRFFKNSSCLWAGAPLYYSLLSRTLIGRLAQGESASLTRKRSSSNLLTPTMFRSSEASPLSCFSFYQMKRAATPKAASTAPITIPTDADTASTAPANTPTAQAAQRPRQSPRSGPKSLQQP